MAASVRDIEADIEGDLVLDETGDLKLAEPLQTIIQDIIFRVRTNFLELRPHPGVGANLQEFLGEANTARRIALGREKVFQALFADRRFRGHEIDVTTFPANRETMGIVVNVVPNFVTETSEQTQVAFLLNYNTGVVEPITI